MADVLRPALALLPVAAFLAVLVLLDSYKLVRLRAVVAVVLAGMLVACVAYALNGALLAHIDFRTYTRYVAPPIEEALKALVIAALIRAHRVGFLVDAAIVGFAVGTGFAMVENLDYLAQWPGSALGTWVVRGFGTALMHGGAAASFAVLALALLERAGRWRWRAVLPGYALAVLLHSAFNHLLASPLNATLGIVFVLPLVLWAVFAKSEAALGEWLGRGFDADAEMLELINSGGLADSPIGRYLHELKARFHGPVIADMLCYLRMHTELALRAKGVLLARENGFDVPVDEATREKFAELGYLEKSIGRTGLLALHPVLRRSRRDLWQLYLLGK
ncbi:MAG TPA: PrsW family glutamic-type intramembrane protease [Burkholderiales bacterium]|nr:PrsW family glutamic-type intramembrane protease [Burkholderiales bacterium]